MATPRQKELIEELLHELGWDRRDLARCAHEYEDYESLDAAAVSELIDLLIDERRRQQRFERS